MVVVGGVIMAYFKRYVNVRMHTCKSSELLFQVTFTVHVVQVSLWVCQSPTLYNSLFGHPLFNQKRSVDHFNYIVCHQHYRGW